MKAGIREIWAEGKDPKGAGALGRYLHGKYIRLRGSNYGFEYIEGTVKTTKNMVRQELDGSCSAACVRQIGRDYGVYWSEAKVRQILKTTDDGTLHEDIVEGVKEILKGKPGITIMDDTFDGDLVEGVKTLRKIYEGKAKKITLIVALEDAENDISHSVIVDNVTEDVVIIRDPTDINLEAGPRRPGNAGSDDYGVEAQMLYHDFLLRWQEGGYEYIIIKEL